MAHSYISNKLADVERTVSITDSSLLLFIAFFIKQTSNSRVPSSAKILLAHYKNQLSNSGPGCIDLFLEKTQNSVVKNWYLLILNQIVNNLDEHLEERILKLIPDLIVDLKWVLFEDDMFSRRHIYFINDVEIYSPRS